MKKLYSILFVFVVSQALDICATKPRRTLYKAYQIHKQTSAVLQPRKRLELPLVRQSSNWTCGVASLMSVLAYFGIQFREDVLINTLGSTNCNPNIGTAYESIVALANVELKKKYGNSPNVGAVAKFNMTPEDLEKAIDAGSPVQVALQAWTCPNTDPKKINCSNNQSIVNYYSTDNDDGHYAVVIGYDDYNFYFMDPSTIGNYTYIPKQEFAARWHDVDGTDNKPVINLGIIYSNGLYGNPPIFNSAPILQLTEATQYPFFTTQLPYILPQSVLNVPKTRQSSNWTSELAVLQSVLYYFGVEHRQDAIASSDQGELNLKQNGVAIDVLKPNEFVKIDNNQVVNYLETQIKQNFPNAKVILNENMSISELERYIYYYKTPVIVEFEPWTTPNTDIDDGRFAVVIGYSKDLIYLMSPSTLGNYTYMSITDFQKRWKRGNLGGGLGIIVSNGLQNNTPMFYPYSIPKLG